MERIGVGRCSEGRTLRGAFSDGAGRIVEC
jgi:hypothetical protein